MKIQQTYTKNYQPACGAKFLHSESLKQIADYAVEHNKFDKLNQARKNIDSACLLTRLRVDTGINEKGFPFITFTRFEPKKNVNIAMSMDDYQQTKITLFESKRKENLFKFALEKIIKLSNNAPKNNMYKDVVINKK